MKLEMTNDGDGRSSPIGSGLVAAVIALAALAAVAVGAGTRMRAPPSPGRARSRCGSRRGSSFGLPASTSPRRLARAALSRSARQLGLPRSLAGVRLARDLRTPPGPAGAVALHNLRFQQTSGGRRVIWSQLDVLIAGGKVRSINATVVPVKRGRAATRPQISSRRALAIAHRAVAGREGRSLRSW